jgi:hypothetical protein
MVEKNFKNKSHKRTRSKYSLKSSKHSFIDKLSKKTNKYIDKFESKKNKMKNKMKNKKSKNKSKNIRLKSKKSKSKKSKSKKSKSKKSKKSNMKGGGSFVVKGMNIQPEGNYSGLTIPDMIASFSDKFKC